MKKLRFRNHRRLKTHRRIRHRIGGTAECPRMCVFRSLKHIYVQLIDDQGGRTLAAASTVHLEGKKLKHGGNLQAAKSVGSAIASVAGEKGIKQVVFDRGGYIYHGRIKALAEAAREGGLKF